MNAKYFMVGRRVNGEHVDNVYAKQRGLPPLRGLVRHIVGYPNERRFSVPVDGPKFAPAFGV
jgi:hypothetical protein